MKLTDWLDNELSQDIWKKKYRYNNETLEEFFNRVSGGDSFIKQLIKDKKVMPAGRILANKGLEKDNKKITYSNCYFIPAPEDNIESIFDTAKEMARTFSYGGGVGTCIHKLSPKGSEIRNAAKNTSGSVSFMNLYNVVTELIGQQGRRGALIITNHIDHPDIEDFIDVKSDLNKVTKANISIKITNQFMEKVKNDEIHTLQFTRPETGEVIKKDVKARDLFYKIAESNWRMAEPGMLFWDRINNWSMLSNHPEFIYQGVNPCGEQSLADYGNCHLASINLSEFVINPFTNNAHIDYKGLNYAIDKLVIYMDRLINESKNLHPLKEQREMADNWRLMGIGIMGLAEMLIKLGLKYGTYALNTCYNLGSHILNRAIEQSAYLAKLYGSYPKFKLEYILESEFVKQNITKENIELIKQYGIRNGALLSIAPNGSISTMLGISGGMEPLFNIFYWRKTESLHGEDKYYKVYSNIAKEYMDLYNIENENELPDYFVTAHDISYEERIEIQQAWQKYVDASISSTINLPEETTINDVKDLYIKAWESGLKGVTIYRDKCEREGILFNQYNEKETELQRGEIKYAPIESLHSKTSKLMTGCGSAYLTLTKDNDGYIDQCFISRGSTGTCLSNQTALSRMISLSLRGGIDVEDIIDQLTSVPTCPAYYGQRCKGKDLSKGSSCPSAIALEIKRYNSEDIIEKYNQVKEVIDVKKESNFCPDCGDELIHQVGCTNCISCGFSTCS